MRAVKKDRRLIIKTLDETEALTAIEVLLYATKSRTGLWGNRDMMVYEYGSKSRTLRRRFREPEPFSADLSFAGIISEIWRWYLYIFADGKELSAKDIFNRYIKCAAFSNSQPMKTVKFMENSQNTSGYIGLTSSEWVFKGYVYEVDDLLSDAEARLLILEHFDKERQKFETLKAKFDSTSTAEIMYERQRIPEKVRIEVWRRDGGQCARCGSRERLEYDHIVPVTKGGSNTARNIELLCEDCNRKKSNNIV